MILAAIAHLGAKKFPKHRKSRLEGRFPRVKSSRQVPGYVWGAAAEISFRRRRENLTKQDEVRRSRGMT